MVTKEPDQEQQKREQRNTAHALAAAKVDREQSGQRETGSDRADIPQVGNERHTDRNGDAYEDRYGLPIEDDHQHQRPDRIAEQDVAFPEKDEVGRTEHGQGQHAAQVNDLEFAPGSLSPRQHHRESHAEQQRKNRPELALDEIQDKPAGPPIEAGEARRHACAEAGDRAIEPLDVHQEDAEQRKPADDIQGFDSLIRGNRHQILVGHRQRCCC